MQPPHHHQPEGDAPHPQKRLGFEIGREEPILGEETPHEPHPADDDGTDGQDGIAQE